MTTQQLVTLFARKQSHATIETKNKLIAFLNAHGVNFQVDDHPRTLEGIVCTTALKTVPIESVTQGLMVSIGGDGGILRLFPHALQHQLPLTAINLGRVGFLADIHADDFAGLLDIIHGHYVEEQRQTLQCALIRKGKTVTRGVALNEVALTSHTPGRIIHVNANWKDFNSMYHADGLIIATPTGSTGYSLSAGGSVVHPQLDAHMVTPICPSPRNRPPILLPTNYDITLSIPAYSSRGGTLCADGRFLDTMMPGDHLIVQKNPKKLKLYHPKHYNFLQMIGQKLQPGDNTNHAEKN
jgi:NAD+ kinase